MGHCRALRCLQVKPAGRGRPQQMGVLGKLLDTKQPRLSPGRAALPPPSHGSKQYLRCPQAQRARAYRSARAPHPRSRSRAAQARGAARMRLLWENCACAPAALTQARCNRPALYPVRP